MVNPSLTTKGEETYTLSENAKKLFRAIYKSQTPKHVDDNIPKIKVSDIISKMAFYYEKIRNSVDYEEEHLLRKNAIERILRREILIQGSIKKIKDEFISKHLLTELIRAGYLENDTIPESKIDEVTILINKYQKLRFFILEGIRPSEYLKRGDVNGANEELKIKNELNSWVFTMMASDIEEKLGGNNVNKVVVNYIFDELKDNIKISDDSPYEADLQIQLYLAIYKNLFKFDKGMLSFILFKYFISDWDKDVDDSEIRKISEDIVGLRQAIDIQLDHPLAPKLNKIVKRYSVYFGILVDVISDNPEDVHKKITQDPKAFTRSIKQACEKKYKSAKSKLWRAGLRSIVYIFITKSILAFIMEVPLANMLGQTVSNFSLIINVIVPPLILFFVIAITTLPGKDNTDKIVEGIEEVFFVEKKRETPYLLTPKSKKKFAITYIFGIMYALTFLSSFGAVVWVLNRLNFNFISITIFLFFLALVSFFSIRIKRGVKELLVIESKENIFSLLLDFFYVPIIVVGKWLSEKFSNLNVFVFVLDFFIEAPFKIFVEIAEEWTKYVKDRKDEIV